MWMTDYIREIQRQLVDVYGFRARPDIPGIPLDVPDGEYPMTIGGKLDRVRVTGGKIHVNIDEEVEQATASHPSQHGGE